MEYSQLTNQSPNFSFLINPHTVITTEFNPALCDSQNALSQGFIGCDLRQQSARLMINKISEIFRNFDLFPRLIFPCSPLFGDNLWIQPHNRNSTKWSNTIIHWGVIYGNKRQFLVINYPKALFSQLLERCFFSNKWRYSCRIEPEIWHPLEYNHTERTGWFYFLEGHYHWNVAENISKRRTGHQVSSFDRSSEAKMT